MGQDKINELLTEMTLAIAERGVKQLANSNPHELIKHVAKAKDEGEFHEIGLDLMKAASSFVIEYCMESETMDPQEATDSLREFLVEYMRKRS